MRKSKKVLAVISCCLAAALAFGGLAGCSQASSTSGSSNGQAKSVDTDLANMTWDDIVDEAKGQTVSFLAWGAGGADAYVQKYWEELQSYVKDEYDINLELTEFSQAEYQKISTDIANGGKPTYDMFWYIGSMIEPFRSADGLFEDEWMTKMENYKYLDLNDPYVTFDGINDTDNMESPFQGCNPSLVYSQQNWDASLAWDATENGKSGLFHNFSELYEWVQLHPGQFTYMDLTGAGNFHGILFVKAILSELTDDGNGGWRPVYDEADDAATRQQKIQANIDQWYNWASSDEATEEAFYEKAAYAWAYLNDLKPFLLQGDNGPLYVATAPEMMNYVKAGDLACTFTTCTSIASRVAETPDAYMAEPAIYMLQTSVGYWDYNVIMKNSESKAAAMVVCNAMLDPEQQALAFETTGNGYNIDVNKLDSADKTAFEDVIEDMGTLSPTSEEISMQSYTDMFGKVSNWISSGWDQMVNRA